MTPLRRIARPMLAAIFITGGADTLRNPAARVGVAEDVATSVAQRIPGLEDRDPEELVRINAGVQVGAGALLALNRFPRLASLVLAATLVPTTAAAHKFWELDDPAARKQQQAHFFKNVSILGGLLLAAADTAGKPGLAWRTRHTAEHAGAAVHRSRREARRAAKAARAKLPV